MIAKRRIIVPILLIAPAITTVPWLIFTSGAITAARMNKRDQLAACCQNQFAKSPTSRGIHQWRQQAGASPRLAGSAFVSALRLKKRRSRAWAVVDEARDGFARGSPNVRDHAAMGAASDNFYGSFRARHNAAWFDDHSEIGSFYGAQQSLVLRHECDLILPSTS
jgi:hypothetical protein